MFQCDIGLQVEKCSECVSHGLKWSVSLARFLVGNEGAENERLGHPPVIVDFWGHQTCIVLPLFKSLSFWDHSSRNWGTCWRPMICRFSMFPIFSSIAMAIVLISQCPNQWNTLFQSMDNWKIMDTQIKVKGKSILIFKYPRMAHRWTIYLRTFWMLDAAGNKCHHFPSGTECTIYIIWINNYMHIYIYMYKI